MACHQKIKIYDETNELKQKLLNTRNLQFSGNPFSESSEVALTAIWKLIYKPARLLNKTDDFYFISTSTLLHQ